MHKLIKHTAFAMAAALLLPATLAMGETSTRSKAQQEAIHLSKTVERAAHKIQKQAGHLTNVAISNGSHKHGLHRIATEVNENLNPSLVRLDALKSELPEWNRKAIDQMRESTATLALSANAAAANRSQKQLMPAFGDADYKQLLSNIDKQADRLVKLSDAAADYSIATADYAEARRAGADAGLAIQLWD